MATFQPTKSLARTPSTSRSNAVPDMASSVVHRLKRTTATDQPKLMEPRQSPSRIHAYKATLQPLAPRLLFERQNIDGSQLRVQHTGSFRGKPILIVTGTDDIDHPRDVDGRTSDWLAGLGARVDYWFLEDQGIKGNGHMMMLEENSDEIANLIESWIRSNVGARGPAGKSVDPRVSRVPAPWPAFTARKV